MSSDVEGTQETNQRGTNDAERLSQDPAMRVVVGWQGSDRNAARTNTMSRFETETLTQEDNLKGLALMNPQWVELAMAHTPLGESSAWSAGRSRMERNMELVLRILRGVNTSKGDSGAGFTYVIVPGHEHIIKQPNVVLLPADVCPDASTLYYHFAIMEQADLIETTRGGYVGYYLVCRLTWNGNDFLHNIEQEGVIEHIEAKHGSRWRDWSLDVMKTVSVEVAKQLALKPFL